MGSVIAEDKTFYNVDTRKNATMTTLTAMEIDVIISVRPVAQKTDWQRDVRSRRY
jgi:hypothetical protein